MGKGITNPVPLPSRADLHDSIRGRVREAIEELLKEELEHLLGSERYERCEERRGYRHGSEVRRVTTEYGPMDLQVPRGRIRQPEGGYSEARSEMLPRYARRTKRIDEAILGCYLAGANTRRIRKALEPLLGSEHLSKSAVSRVVGRLKEVFAGWDARDLSGESYAILYLDAIHLKVRLARRVVSVPVLAALGVREDGQKVLVALRPAVRESEASWKGLMENLEERGLPTPALIISDGHKGLTKAVALWPEAKVQRCTFHKGENLRTHCPKHAQAEMGRDYDRIVHARNGLRARQAYKQFVTKWSVLCPSVAKSLEEAGERLLTFYEFPKAMWKSIRSTNIIENLNREFRRRTKTQGSFSNEAAAVTLLYGLVAFGQIRLRRIDGYKHLPKVVKEVKQAAA